jgi:tetratricopeptide (TPR) repeat protein
MRASRRNSVNDHPSRDVLSALVRGELSVKEIRALVPHLEGPCMECTGVMEMIRQDLREGRPGAYELTPDEDTAYDAAIGRALRGVRKAHRARQREQAEAARAAGILTQGEGLKAGQKLPRKLGEIPRLEALLAKSWSLRHENPSEMVQFAMLAVRHAQRLDPRRHGVEQVMDLRGRTYAELGNSYRVLDQHDLAERNLDRARQVLELGSGDERLQIRLLDLEASLAADRRRFDLAAHYLLRVVDFHQRNGNQHLAGRATISRGLYRGYSGNPEEAIRILQEGLSMIDEQREPSLVYSALHNQFLFIVETGRFREAKIFRLRNIEVLSRNEGKTNAVGLRWTEGRIDAGLGNFFGAETAFREVKHDYEEIGRPYLASITAIDLAAVLLAQQRLKEAKELAFGAAKVFQALHIEREALGAVIALCTAFEMERVDQEWVEDVADFLRRLERDPNAQFELRRR